MTFASSNGISVWNQGIVCFEVPHSRVRSVQRNGFDLGFPFFFWWSSLSIRTNRTKKDETFRFFRVLHVLSSYRWITKRRTTRLLTKATKAFPVNTNLASHERLALREGTFSTALSNAILLPIRRGVDRRWIWMLLYEMRRRADPIHFRLFGIFSYRFQRPRFEPFLVGGSFGDDERETLALRCTRDGRYTT